MSGIVTILLTSLLTIFGTILAALAVSVLGVRSYRVQKETDRQVELRKQQRTAYELCAQSYYEWTYTKAGSVEDEKADTAYRQAYFKLITLASDGFLRAAMAFHTFAEVPPYPDLAREGGRRRFAQLWASLVLEMRKDANAESQAEEAEITSHIPWSQGSFAPPQGPANEGNRESHPGDRE